MEKMTNFDQTDLSTLIQICNLAITCHRMRQYELIFSGKFDDFTQVLSYYR
jgi:hypothetical protein